MTVWASFECPICEDEQVASPVDFVMRSLPIPTARVWCPDCEVQVAFRVTPSEWWRLVNARTEALADWHDEVEAVVTPADLP